MRDRFDHFLATRAEAAGAELCTGQAVRQVQSLPDRVVVETRDRSFAARAVVGADGANGVVAREAGLAAGRRFAVALEAEVGVSAAALEQWSGLLHLHFGGVPWGYAWVFPKADHLSVGVATFQDRRRIDLRAALNQFLDGLPPLRERQVRLLRGHRIPLGGPPRQLHSGRVLLAGDAGGFADPFLGEGIYYAVRSGQLAADCLLPALAGGGPPDLSPYTRAANRGFHREFRYAGRIAALFYRWPRLACRVHFASPVMQSVTFRILEAGFSYRAACYYLAARLPHLARALLFGPPRGDGPPRPAGH